MLYHIRNLEGRFHMLVWHMKRYHYAMYKKKEAELSYMYKRPSSTIIREKLETGRKYQAAKREFSRQIMYL